jgi:phosphoglycerate dehydrogenase-like enzyme
MPRLLVTYSDSHDRPMGLVREVFNEFAIQTLEVPAGGLDVDASAALTTALADCEACLLRPGRLTREVFAAATELDVVALTGSGVDHIDLAAATDHGVVVANAPGGPAPSVVEHTFGLTFALLRDVIEKDRRVRAGDWAQARSPITELCGQTLGVLGVGTIGLEVARTAAERFGADVLGYDPYVTETREHPVFPRYDRETVEAAGVELVARPDLFERATVVTVHTPLTDETEGLVGATELAALGDGYLINTARGGIVEESALRTALVEGQLAGAALDVFDTEPPTPDDPLLEAPNLLASPHVAGVSDRTQKRGLRQAADAIRTALAGGRPETVVNPGVYE